MPMPSLVFVLGAAKAHALHDTLSSRHVEARAMEVRPPFELMAKAGLASARLALALAPDARSFWVAAGPGNNGGDGLVAALHLHRAGKRVRVTLSGESAHQPDDARRALAEAQAAGVTISTAMPLEAPDVAIDALLGLGQRRAPEGQLGELVNSLNAWGAPILSLDLPTGLCADTGRVLGSAVVRARATISLLTLKPGLFTFQGRDVAGDIWLDRLGIEGPAFDLAGTATARLAGADDARCVLPPRRHVQHKGSFGDVWVVGGAAGMGGAARLAGHAALVAGAGRVYVSRLDGAMDDDPSLPELMHRGPDGWRRPGALEAATVVCGCGAGEAVRDVLPEIIHRAGRLVLDADALNAIAAEPALADALVRRGRASRPSVLTPHPLEAARLAGSGSADIQSNRLAGAQRLAERFLAVVVLKGSGTVIAAPGQLPVINPSGNGRLATAGTGDVLAGWLGGLWSAAAPNRAEAAPVAQASQVAAAAVWLHGHAAEVSARGPSAVSHAVSELPLIASALVRALAMASADAVGALPARS